MAQQPSITAKAHTFMTSHADTRPPEATLQAVKDALRANAEELIDFTAKRLAHLGARLEWDSEDNFEVTETLAGVLAPRWGLPSATSLDDAAALAFWSTIAVDELGQEIDAVDGYPSEGSTNPPNGVRTTPFGGRIGR